MPPQSSQNSADGVRDRVPWIARSPAREVRADNLEQDGPDDQVQRNFARRRHLIVLPQAQPALHQQQRRQRAGNQQHIVEITVEEKVVNARLEAPAVDGVKQAGQEKQAVAQITESLQRSARIARPNATDMVILNNNIIAEK